MLVHGRPLVHWDDCFRCRWSITKGAERVAELVISREEAKHLATKSDVADLRADLRVITARLNLLSALNVGIFVSVLATFVVA